MSYRFHACWLVAASIAAWPLHAPAKVLDHWRFDELTGLVAADSGGLVANNATWQDATSANLSWGPGLIGNAAVLTGELGSSNVFNVGSIEADGVTQLSYSVWVKPNLAQLGSGGDLDNKGIFTTGTLTALRSGGPTANQFWGATWSTQNKFRIDATGTFNSAPIYDGTETEPEWIHLAFTWDGTAGNANAGDEVVKTYINGVLVNTATRNVSQIIDDGSWQIGRDRTFAGRTFGGMIDDLAVWDQVLSEEQIGLIYNGGLAGDDAITSLSLGVGIPGDVNDSGVADSADFEIIRQNFWQPIAERNQGDLIDNDFIDFADYGAWRKAVQNAAGSSSAQLTVPEPTSLVLLCVAAALCVGRRQR
jgi:Concanavalin A-like lectin/glucanases superfamily